METRQIRDAQDLETGQLIYIKGHAKATYMSDGRTVEDAINSVSGGGSSDANVQAVDTGDVIDDVTVDYATKTYVDGLVTNYATISYVDSKVSNYATISYVDELVGDINSVLESIINGGGAALITFNIGGAEYQAEEGMTWEEWVNSDYNTGDYYINSYGNVWGVVSSIGGVNPTDKIIANNTYEYGANQGGAI